jgi:hypothetical protein
MEKNILTLLFSTFLLGILTTNLSLAAERHTASFDKIVSSAICSLEGENEIDQARQILVRSRSTSDLDAYLTHIQIKAIFKKVVRECENISEADLYFLDKEFSTFLKLDARSLSRTIERSNLGLGYEIGGPVFSCSDNPGGLEVGRETVPSPCN